MPWQRRLQRPCSLEKGRRVDAVPRVLLLAAPLPIADSRQGRPRMGLTKALQLAGELENEELLRKLLLRK